MTTPPGLTAFVDLSGLVPSAADAALSALARADRLGAMVTQAIVHAPSGTHTTVRGWHVVRDDARQACAWAFERAAIDGHALLIVAAGSMPGADAVGGLIEALDCDPLCGIAVPRFSPGADRIALVERFGPGDATAPRRTLAPQPDYRFTAESVAPCFLIKREIVGNLAFVPRHTVWTSLADLVIRMRRAGFRPVQCQRVVVPLDGAVTWGCTPPELDELRVGLGEAPEETPPGDRALRAERVLACALDRPQSLLVDARNLTPRYNGTTAAILGACDGLHRVRLDGEVTLWAHPDSVESHRLAARFPRWSISDATPVGPFAAALRLSQPWHAADLDTLSDLAAVNVFWMLDTIAWDIGYAAPQDLDATWTRLATDADGILFISAFSQERFVNRFTVPAAVALDACPLSLDPADYVVPVPERTTQAYWLVVGNHYDHKHVAPTVDLLTRAFPSRNLVVMGDRAQPRSPRVTQLTSGALDQALVVSGYAHADVVVFPSFYEGFGLPMIEGLAYGRSVVVRDSALVRELAARYTGPGRIFVFSTERELVDVLGRLDRGDDSSAIAMGSAAAGPRWDWTAVASCMLRTVDQLVAEAPSPQMLRRTTLARGLSRNRRRPERAAPAGWS